MSEPIVHELDLPPEALAEGGQEVLRAFVVEGELHVSLQPAFDRPAIWGTLLAETARHIARMYSKAGIAHYDQALNEIHRSLQAEWSNPSDDGETELTN
jgi:hypothetical protein